MALGFVLWRPDALRDDRAAMPDRVVEQPDGLPLGDGEMLCAGHWRVANEERGGPLWDADSSKGARVHLQEAREVHCCAFRSEHLSDVTVDI